MRQPSQQVGVPLRPDGLSHNKSHGRPRGRLNRLGHPHRQHGNNRYHPLVIRFRTKIGHYVLLLRGRHALNLADRPTDSARQMLDPTRRRRTRRQRRIPSTPDRPPTGLILPNGTSDRAASDHVNKRGQHPRRPTSPAYPSAATETHQSGPVRKRRLIPLTPIEATRRQVRVPPSHSTAARSKEQLSIRTAPRHPDQCKGDVPSPANPGTHGSPLLLCPRKTSAHESHVSGHRHPQTKT